MATDADFGTFSLLLEGAAKLRGNLQLTEEQGRRLTAAILWQFSREGVETSENEAPKKWPAIPHGYEKQCH